MAKAARILRLILHCASPQERGLTLSLLYCTIIVGRRAGREEGYWIFSNYLIHGRGTSGHGAPSTSQEQTL
ncbi:hypothetical protein AMATHDRAFT_68220 [Amanita thiersii Skay4041]|uniref:Uncharacterized protein n=1 Tax=Amanita thiersii Skay4041 TaxID=703135 RepID=A0A2A9N8R6_9AGAR|nr:hypothetical protein AMATHDRAFT_68220 [Amanita thiersii Skay4041]